MESISFYDWDNYKNYDVGLFMTYPNDLVDLARAKMSNPSLIVGLIDPRGGQIKGYTAYIDFFIVDSIEMRDYYAGYHKPILTYYEYPNFPSINKTHEDKNPVILGYHGNRVHLEGMYPNLTRAIELIGDEYNVELWAMYNIQALGEFKYGKPKNVRVRHIQWAEENYTKVLSKVDIGLVPSLMPIKNLRKAKKRLSINSEFFNDSDDDYLIRFKMPTNPGRIIVFSKLGIPVISDMFPSALQLIEDNTDGMIAYSSGGWYRAIKTLIEDHSLRNRMAYFMQKKIDKSFDYKVQNEKFMKFMNTLILPQKDSRVHPIESPRADLSQILGFSRFTWKMKRAKIKGEIVKIIPKRLKLFLNSRHSNSMN